MWWGRGADAAPRPPPMKTTPFQPADLRRSVIAVPPLCRRRDDDLTLDEAHNRQLIRHLEGGGVTTLLYGGNANLYHIAPTEYPQLLDLLEGSVSAETWVVPSAGPMFGTLMDQAAVLAGRSFPTAMVLPTLFPATISGVMTAVRRFAERAGFPAVLYLKDDAYLTPQAVAALVADGVVSWIKYAVVRADPAEDPFLEQLVALVDPSIIVSGIGEQPAVAHVLGFGLAGFTSGCVCVAPSKSMDVLRALQAGDSGEAAALLERFRPLEDLRNTHGPIPVLHHAVALAGIAETGAHLPMLSALEGGAVEAIAEAAAGLLEFERAG